MSNFEELPAAMEWPKLRAKFLFVQRRERAREGDAQLTASQAYGVIAQSRYNELSDTRATAALAGTENFLHVDEDDFVISLRTFEGGIERARENGCISPAYTVMRPSSQVEPTFFQYLLKSSAFIQILQTAVTGIRDGKSVRYEQFADLVLPVPDRKIQKAIADFLDRETVRIDELIDKKIRFLALSDERWKAALNQEVFPNAPDWRQLPSGWRTVRLKYLTDPKRPIMYGIVLPGPNMDRGPLIVKGGDVKPGRLRPDSLCRTTEEIEARYARSRLKAGDLVISIRGGIGDIEIVPSEIEGANLTQDAARIAPRQGVDRDWLRFALSSPAVFHPLEARSLGAAVRGINIFDLKRVFVPEPPSNIQSQLAVRLKEKEYRLSRLRERVVVHAERLREFRTAIVTAAVTGQIDVSEWSRRGEGDRRLDRIQEEMTSQEARA